MDNLRNSSSSSKPSPNACPTRPGPRRLQIPCSKWPKKHQTLQPQPTPTRTEPERNANNPEQSRTQPEQIPHDAEQSRTQPEPSASAAVATSDATPPPAELPVVKSDDEDVIDAAAELHYHMKGRSRFDKLSAEQQLAIVEMMNTFNSDTVRNIISQPPPVGFSLKIGKTALCAFVKRFNKRLAERRLEEATKIVTDELNNSTDPSHDFAEAFERCLQIKALIAVADRNTTLETIDALTTTITRLRKQSLAERKQLHVELSK
jgi:hypothetical protein